MVLVTLTAACIAMAADAYRLPESDLYAILAVEGGRVGQAAASAGGSSDLGPFQVNSRWGPALGRFWGVSSEDALSRLKNNGCAKGPSRKPVGIWRPRSASITRTPRLCLKRIE